jgi:4-hydroxybenzoate polyprenyltransferase
MNTHVTSSPGRAQEKSAWAKTKLFAQTVRIEQTLLALPFAYLTLFLASGGLPSFSNFIWITVAMTGARTFGMAANRYIDAAIDARNPRTASRPMASGRLSRMEMLAFMAAAVAVFLIGVFNLSPWSRYLWPVVLAAITVYPYTKRFTWLCHLGVAAIYVMVPTGVWIAVTNSLGIAPLVLGLAAGFWATGFDIIYQSQDYEYDRRHGLNSLTARFGPRKALLLARLSHTLAVAGILTAGLLFDAGPLYFVGVATFAALAIYEHRLVSPRDLSKANVAFFNMNGIISVQFFLFVAADTLAR